MPRKTADTDTVHTTTAFSGFDQPEANWFRMPNNWTDITAQIDNIAELKIVEYVLRHTWGYREFNIKKHITVDEFMRGRKRKDGERLDQGTGLSERSVYNGLAKAVEHGFIEEAVDDSDRARVKKYYSLNMKPEPSRGDDASDQEDALGVHDLQAGVQSLHPGSQSLQGRGANFAPRSEKDTLDRQHVERYLSSNIDISIAQAGKQKQGRPRARTTQSDDLPNSLIQSTDDQAAQVRSVLEPYIGEMRHTVGDKATLKASTTRTLNLYNSAGVPVAAFLGCHYEALAITKDRARSGSIHAHDGASYYFRVLENLLHPDAAPAIQLDIPSTPAALETPRSDGTVGEGGASASSTHPIWAALLTALRPELTPENFAAWFSRTTVVGQEGQKLVVSVPNSFHQYWLDVRLRGVIERTMKRLGHGSLHVSIVSAEPGPAAAQTSNLFHTA